MNEWLPIEDAPKDGTPVLASTDAGEYWPDKVWWDDEIKQWVQFIHPTTGKRFYPSIPLTHYMLMPEPVFVRQKDTESGQK